jgi:Peptidase family M28
MKKPSVSAQIFILFVLYGAIMLVYWCVKMPGETLSSLLLPLTQSQKESSQRLQDYVWRLAGEIDERNYGEPKAYNKAADLIADAFQQNSLVPYEEQLGDKLQYRNIIAEHYGTSLPDEIIVIGAHYDTVWMSPGADDNASGVAVMLELARQLKSKKLARTIRFIAFANEEHPHYFTNNMGSLFHAKKAYDRGDNIKAMISLEMLGYYSDESNSQSYPSPFSWFYPDTANFVAFVSNFGSRNLMRRSIRLFRETAQFPSEGLAAPIALVPDVRRSDQAAFWHHGFKAFMVTDTAAYRNYAYHNVSDVPNSLDYEAMARITTGLITVVEQLARME